MEKMALLLSTDNWNKVSIYQKFLSEKNIASWRIGKKYSDKYLNNIPSPINLYFFHRNKVKYCASCKEIKSGISWSLSEVPIEFHSDRTPYVTNVRLSSLKEIPEIHITKFTKWDKPNQHFEQGQLGILKVVDILGKNDDANN